RDDQGEGAGLGAACGNRRAWERRSVGDRRRKLSPQDRLELSLRNESSHRPCVAGKLSGTEIGRAKDRTRLEVVRGDDHWCPLGRGAVHRPIAPEGGEHEYEPDQRERLGEPPPGRGTRHGDFVRAAKANLRMTVRARLDLNIGRSPETHLTSSRGSL